MPYKLNFMYKIGKMGGGLSVTCPLYYSRRRDWGTKMPLRLQPFFLRKHFPSSKWWRQRNLFCCRAFYLLLVLLKAKEGKEREEEHIFLQRSYQTYVESLKDKNMFTPEAQKEALLKAGEMALAQLTEDSKKWIETNFGDVKTWITNTIESVIYDLKNKPAGESTNEEA